MGEMDVFTFVDSEREGYAHDGAAANEYMYSTLRFSGVHFTIDTT